MTVSAPPRAAIETIPLWAGRAIETTPVAGGLTNENWRVTEADSGRSYFLKLPGAGTEAFVDRDCAHAAGLAAGQLGIGPRVLYFDPVSGIEVTEFLEGHRAACPADFARLEMAAKVLELYRAFNAGAQLPRTKSFLDMIDEHWTQAEELNVPIPEGGEPLLAAYRGARTAFLAAGLDLAPCHNDPAAGNFLIGDDGAMRLVDFDYASNNDPAYELGVFLAEIFANEPLTRALIEHYAGRIDRTFAARVWVARALADLKWGLWGLVSARLKDGGFDYYKFGTWKLERGARLATDSRWASWLAEL